MQTYEIDAVRELIEQLIAELGVDNVPAELDVDGVLKMLENENACEKEGSEIPVASDEGQMAE